jgi:hypothetical protein
LKFEILTHMLWKEWYTYCEVDTVNRLIIVYRLWSWNYEQIEIHIVKLKLWTDWYTVCEAKMMKILIQNVKLNRWKCCEAELL